MPASTLRTLGFLRTWLADTDGGVRREVEIPGVDRTIPASVFLPDDLSRRNAGPILPPDRSYPVWIVLHGVTRPGRKHEQLVRFCGALAGAGAVAVVPEIREWVELCLAPELTVPVIRSTVDWLDRGEAGLVGFSFGAPQALRAAADPRLRERIAGVTGFGGYFDVERTVRFQLTGRHEWRGEEKWLDPDPYGRWIMAANHLTGVAGHEDAVDVARALRRLAAIAGDARIPSDSREMAEHRRELRTTVAASRRPLFDLLATRPGGDGSPPDGEGREGREPVGGRADSEGDGEPDPTEIRRARLESLARELSRAALAADPLLDVREHLGGIRCPVELVHGRFDRLVPYTESLRLAEAFPSGSRVRVTVTRLFSHTEGRSLIPGIAGALEGWRFFAALRRVLGMI